MPNFEKISTIAEKIKTNKKLAVLIILLFILSFVGIVRFTLPKEKNIVNAKTGPVIEAVYGRGTVVPTRSYQIKIGVISNIRKLFVKEGDFVKSGDPLIELEQIALFRAPFNGTVTAIPFKIGETVFPQIPILTFMDLKDRYITVSLEQQGALRVKKGQVARIIFESLRGQKFSGNVRAIFPTENQFTVHIDAKDLPLEILPGMTADVAIEIDRRENALLVPISAVNSGKIVIIRDGKKIKTDVKIGVVDGEFGEVISGDIKATDSILLPKEN